MFSFPRLEDSCGCNWMTFKHCGCHIKEKFSFSFRFNACCNTLALLELILCLFISHASFHEGKRAKVKRKRAIEQMEKVWEKLWSWCFRVNLWLFVMRMRWNLVDLAVTFEKWWVRKVKLVKLLWSYLMTSGFLKLLTFFNRVDFYFLWEMIMSSA